MSCGLLVCAKVGEVVRLGAVCLSMYLYRGGMDDVEGNDVILYYDKHNCQSVYIHINYDWMDPFNC